MLVKVLWDEINGQKPLPFDVLDSSGQVLLHAGQSVERHQFKHLEAIGLFRYQHELPITWIVQEEFSEQLNMDKVKALLKSPSSYPDAETEAPLIDSGDAKPYLFAMNAFWSKLEAGEALDMALLEVIQGELVSSIVQKMDQLKYLNQLRLRDEVTYSHTLDVTSVSIALGNALGLDAIDLKYLALGGLLHDLGKLFIPRGVMFKASRLTDTEFQVMQKHPEMGYHVLRNELKLPAEICLPALEHQELYAGGGYPQNLAGNQIHPFSQIVKIADVYDALTSRRPYKEAIPSDKAIKIMLLEGAQSFNPKMLRVFLELANFPMADVPEDILSA